MRIKCPDCQTVNQVVEGVPLRQQYCKLCQCALQLDHPEKYGLVNSEPY